MVCLDVDLVLFIFSINNSVSFPQYTLADTSPPGVENRVERVENHLALQDVRLAELNLKLQLIESTTFDGTLIWKIDNFTRRHHDAKIGKTPSLYSPPFYTR